MTEDNPYGFGRHIHERDGGASTLRQAIWKATEAVDDAIVDIEAEVTQ